MNRKYFEHLIRQSILSIFPESEIEYLSVVKACHPTRMGIVIRQNGIPVSPILYVDEIYKCYEMGISIDTILYGIKHKNQSSHGIESYYEEYLENIQAASSRMTFRLINKKQNSQYLETIPHRDYLDFALIYQLVLPFTAKEQGYLCVTDHLIKKWNVTENQLYDIALKRTPQILPPVLAEIHDFFTRMINSSEPFAPILNFSQICWNTDTLFVLSNTSLKYGAGAAVYPGVLKKIGDSMGQDFYVIFSSTNEVLLKRKDSITSAQSLKKELMKINQRAGKIVEFMSNELYYYSREADRLLMY